MDSQCPTMPWTLSEDEKNISNPSNLVKNLKQVGKLLHSNYLENLLQTNKENDDTIRQMRIASLDFRKEIRELKEKEQSALKRSDEYKEKFQNAQKVIEDLHGKNCALFVKNKSLQKQLDERLNATKTRHPFFEDETVFKKPPSVILAPDTCQVDTVALVEDSILIDEDDEETEALDPDETLFVKPFLPQANPTKTIVENTKETPQFPDEFSDDETIDLDETHFENAPSSPVFSKRKSGKLLTPKRNENVDLLHSKIDSDMDTPELKSNKSVSFKTPSRLALLLDSSTEASPSILPQAPLCNIIDIDSPEPENTLEASLNDLFDKTDGDLETTTALQQSQAEGLISPKKDNSVSQKHKKISIHKTDIDFDDSDDDFIPSNQYKSSKNDSAVSATFDKDIEINNMSINEKENHKTCSSRTSKKLEDSNAFWMDNSFDKLPTKSKPTYKHKTVVRDKDKRKNMEGKTCQQCDAFYSHLSEDKKREMLRKVCRHKYEYVPPSTPAHYWDVDMPTTQECRDRGYLNESDTQQFKETRKRRRRPLVAKHKKSSL